MTKGLSAEKRLSGLAAAVASSDGGCSSAAALSLGGSKVEPPSSRPSELKTQQLGPRVP